MIANYNYFIEHYGDIYLDISRTDENLLLIPEILKGDVEINSYLRLMGITSLIEIENKKIFAVAILMATFDKEGFYYLFEHHLTTSVLMTLKRFFTAFKFNQLEVTDVRLATTIDVLAQIAIEQQPTNPNEFYQYLLNEIFPIDGYILEKASLIKILNPAIH